jgi:lipoyl(octanoyl) transferase
MSATISTAGLTAGSTAGAADAEFSARVKPASREPRQPCRYEDLGKIGFGRAWDIQRDLVARRKSGEIADHLLLVEHPHVITLGRNAKVENILAAEDRLTELKVEVCETDRGGDVTYHGPGQIVAYPIVDLGRWKRDITAYVRALELVMLNTVSDFGIEAERVKGCTGVWHRGAKLGSIGVHISRWVTSHGLALNVSTDLDYFDLIVPCGISKPVTSVEQLLGRRLPREDLKARLVWHFGQVFSRDMQPGGAGIEAASRRGIAEKGIE